MCCFFFDMCRFFFSCYVFGMKWYVEEDGIEDMIMVIEFLGWIYFVCGVYWGGMGGVICWCIV